MFFVDKFTLKTSLSFDCISEKLLLYLGALSIDFCFSQEPKQMVVPKTVTAGVAPPSRTAATRGAPLTTTMTARKRITPHHSSRSQLPKPQLRSSQRKRKHPRRQQQSRPKSQSTSIQNQNPTVFRWDFTNHTLRLRASVIEDSTLVLCPEMAL